MQSVLIGWTIAIVVGISLGLLLGSSPRLRNYSTASIDILRPIPGIAFLPVALLLFGFSTRMELFVIVLPVLWPIHAVHHSSHRLYWLNSARMHPLDAASMAALVAAFGPDEANWIGKRVKCNGLRVRPVGVPFGKALTADEANRPLIEWVYARQ
jgi:predicted MFS family arabinose efflux permease